MPSEITLRRTGQAPLVFSGDLVCKVAGQNHKGHEHKRWHELAVYRLEHGGYVLRIAYRSTWEGELGRDSAYILNSPNHAENVSVLRARLSSHLADIDGSKVVRGFPNKPHYAARQAELLADIRARYLDQVSDLLESPEFAERLS